MSDEKITNIEGPWFEDFRVGDDFSDVPSVTITDGHAAIHQAIFGDRIRLPLSKELCLKVCGESRLMVNPSLVANIAIGLSTIPSQRVMGNLFYRGLCLRQPVFIGDTLTTKTRVVGLKQNSIKKGRSASGMVALEIHVLNQNEETVMLFWRCPMIPCKDPQADTGKDDDFSALPEKLEDIEQSIPDWNLSAFRNLVGGEHGSQLQEGSSYIVDARDTVTLAPELVRMTLNMAMTHTDAERSIYGKRLVYGGHTISMAASQISRAFPNMVTILGWHKCDHLAPVFEEDILQSRVKVISKKEITQFSQANGYLVDLEVKVDAVGGRNAPNPGESSSVLDWHLCVLFA